MSGSVSRALTKWCLAISFMLTPAGGVLAVDYPTKPVRIVVPYAAGGSADTLARLIGERLSRRMGQPFIIDNKPGAGTIVGTTAVVNAEADGHTILLGASALTVLPSVNKNFTIDVRRQLVPVSEVVRGMFVVAASPSVPAETLADAIAYSKINPDALSYGTPGVGTSPHLTVEYIKSRTGARLLHVPFGGSSAALRAVLQGEVSLIVDPVFTLKGHIEAGKLKGLAVTGKTRSRFLPALPTVAETAIPGYDVTYWIGFLAPARTPPAVVTKLNAEIAAVVREADMSQRLSDLGFDPVAETPERFSQRIDAELGLWANIAHSAGIKPE